MGSALYTFTHHPYFFSCQHTGMQIRVAACSLVYKKVPLFLRLIITLHQFRFVLLILHTIQCLVLSQKALGQTTIGQMVNIMSNDVNRFDFSVIFLHYLWVGPMQTLISTIILLYVIGPSCLVGLAVLILFVPLQSIDLKKDMYRQYPNFLNSHRFFGQVGWVKFFQNSDLKLQNELMKEFEL